MHASPPHGASTLQKRATTVTCSAPSCTRQSAAAGLAAACCSPAAKAAPTSARLEPRAHQQQQRRARSTAMHSLDARSQCKAPLASRSSFGPCRRSVPVPTARPSGVQTRVVADPAATAPKPSGDGEFASLKKLSLITAVKTPWTPGTGHIDLAAYDRLVQHQVRPRGLSLSWSGRHACQQGAPVRAGTQSVTEARRAGGERRGGRHRGRHDRRGPPDALGRAPAAHRAHRQVLWRQGLWGSRVRQGTRGQRDGSRPGGRWGAAVSAQPAQAHASGMQTTPAMPCHASSMPLPSPGARARTRLLAAARGAAGRHAPVGPQASCVTVQV